MGKVVALVGELGVLVGMVVALVGVVVALVGDALVGVVVALVGRIGEKTPQLTKSHSNLIPNPILRPNSSNANQI